jgi:Ran GTPase-activating protein (RanGAP) involved in mRNA processing and transport
VSQDNTSCTALKLDRNRFSDFGANAFAEGLPSVTHLKHLSVRSNGIRDEGAQALAKCLASTSLESLNLGRNSISESVKGQLKAAKKSCSVTV